MFKGQAIHDLIQLLSARTVKLYHACQLTDFESYLKLGGIPSRQLLECQDLSYTEFISDKNDKNNGDWDKVFGNLSDFGGTFSKGYSGVPTIYGPVLFRLYPEALSEATDVAICLSSAGKKGFDREKESLSSIQEINQLFLHPENNGKKSSYIKKRADLQKDFEKNNASAPEFSCTVASGRLSLEHVHYITVDPYSIHGNSLTNTVNQIISASDYNLPAYERKDSHTFRNELAEFLLVGDDIPNLDHLIQNNSLSQDFRAWAQKLMDKNLGFQFERFSAYLKEGTLVPLIDYSNDI